MTIPLDVLWIVLALVVTFFTGGAIFASLSFESELLKIQAYKDNSFLKLKFFLMFLWWIVPALMGVSVCLILAAINN